MSKKRVQVSKDRGLTWKYRWVDPAELDPKKSNLVPGEWLRRSEEDQVFVISIRDGNLQSDPLEITNKFSFTLATGEEIIVYAVNPNEADSTFVEILIVRGLLKRSCEES